MAFSIEKFKSRVEKTGVLQTNKFDVAITLPKITTAAGGTPFGAYNVISTNNVATGGTTEELTYRCINASLPGVTMRTTDINRFGVGIMEKMPYSANYTDVSLTFLMDRSSSIYDFWYAWFNYIFGVTGQESSKNIFGSYSVGSTGNAGRSFYTAEYKDNYATTMQIVMYNQTGEIAQRINILEAFPTALREVAVAWGDNGNMVKINVSISYSYYTMVATNIKLPA